MGLVDFVLLSIASGGTSVQGQLGEYIKILCFSIG